MGMKRQLRRKKRIAKIRKKQKDAKTKKVSKKTTTGNKKTSPSTRRVKPTPAPAPTTPSRMQSIRDAAKKRNETFKQTGVQTFGGTKKSYTKREVAKIDAAVKANPSLSRSSVTGGVLKNKRKPTSTPTYRSRAEGLAANNLRIQAAKTGPVVDGAAYAKNIVSSRFPGASPNSPVFGMTAKQLNQGAKEMNQPGGPFNQTGPGGPEPEADYTSYQPGSFYNQSDTNMNVTNALRSTRNAVTAPLRALGINTGLTNRLIPKSDEAIQDARDQRSNYNVANDANIVSVRKTKSKGGGRGILSNMTPPAEATTTPVEEILETSQRERYEPAPPPPNLNQLQIDSYNTALENYNAGQGFTGQGVGTGFGDLSEPVIAALIAGTRGRKRFRYGPRSVERGGRSGTGLRRGSQRFQQFTTAGQLNI